MGSIYGQAQIQSHYTVYCFLKQYTICMCVALGLSDPWRSLNSKRKKNEAGERNMKKMLDEGRKIIKEEEGGKQGRKVTSWCLKTNKFWGTYINLTAYTALHFIYVFCPSCCCGCWCFRPAYCCIPFQFPIACASSTNTFHQ